MQPNRPSPLAPMFTVIALVLLIFTAPGCASLMARIQSAPKPTIKFQTVKIAKISWKDADMVANFKITNPDAIPIKMGAFDWKLKISGQQFLTGNNAQGLNAGAKKSTTIPMPFKLNFAKLLNTIRDAKNKKEVPFELAGKVTINTPLGPVALPLSGKGNIPVLQKPKIRLKNITAKMQGMTKAYFEVAMDIDSDNKFALKLGSILYDLKLEGFKVAEGNKSMGKSVAEGRTTTVKLPITVDLIGASQALLSALLSGKVSYDLGTNLKLDTPWGQAPMDWAQKGSVRLY